MSASTPSTPSTPETPFEPTEAPIHRASPRVALRRFWSKYATFSGRASRSEYWWMALIEVVVLVVLGILSHLGGAGVEDSSGRMVGANFLGIGAAVVLVILLIAVIIPNLALAWRRLHDANLSGGFYFLTLIPSIGSLIILVLVLLPSSPYGERFDRR